MTQTFAPDADMPAAAPAVSVRLADYGFEPDGEALVALLDAYARDPMGGGQPLEDAVRQRLVPALDAVPGAFSLLAFDGDEPVGLANCFTGFSTFAARPLINIHDVAVKPTARGRGVGRALMRAVEQEARARGACKITLEVLGGNEPAKALYASLGYGNYALDPEKGTAQFWEKKL
ncbi:GNAT family N-acetyltransferase [Novosphingobium mangrovi (ex Huang et al. 2023)]|uniref:GNAT family N-acetyltransferase n=1 Tax=Novosphingobium mangrovi (ex Huang et al. 2023) TaxID=2976432 RepID=A0ABT2I8V9_9SPHN|nr:GNAT family N-acetyltransferase [Novosphingobium mangrovi (ex Huang et al. 2023)]MCT2401246.1 GNAT family N-acetyltransferase [Novosphingobium mangrovi (ex Huang et al. 2023)]